MNEDYVNRLISEDNLEEAINLLLQNTNDKEAKDDLINCLARLQNHKRQVYLGISEHSNQELNKIRFSILTLKTKVLNNLELSNREENNISNLDILNTTTEKLRIQFFDDFSRQPSWWDDDKWAIGNVYDESRNKIWVGDREQKSNRMLVYSNKDNLDGWGVQTAKKIYINEHKDYLIEVAANPDLKYSGYYTGWAFKWGVSQDYNSFYTFRIFPSKKLSSISFLYSSEEHFIMNEEHFSFISDYNVLKILKAKDRMYYFINDNCIFESKIYSFFGKYIGLWATRGQAAFDYVRVSN